VSKKKLAIVSTYDDLCGIAGYTRALEQQLAGNDLPDGWLAAAVDHHAEHLVSFDRDFKKLLPRTRFTLLKA